MKFNQPAKVVPFQQTRGIFQVSVEAQNQPLRPVVGAEREVELYQTLRTLVNAIISDHENLPLRKILFVFRPCSEKEV